MQQPLKARHAPEGEIPLPMKKKSHVTAVLLELYGAYGVAAILLAFFLNRYQMIEPGMLYQFLNCTGSLGIILISLRKKAWAPAILNMVWGLIAFSAMIRSFWQ